MTNQAKKVYNSGVEVRCECCHRLLCIKRGDKYYVKCRTCKNEVEIKIEPEPKNQEFRATK